MNDLTLTALFDADRERLETALRQERTLPQCLNVLDKALNRLQLQYLEACEDRAQRENAQTILETLRDALPLMEGVGEMRAWKRDVPAAQARKIRPRPLTLAMLIAGGALVLGALLTLRAGSPLTMAACLLTTAAGGALLVFGGRGLAQPAPAAAQEESTRTEVLVDPATLMHRLRGMLMAADARLARRAGEAQAQSAADARPAALSEGVALSGDPLELLSDLMEIAYAQRGTQADADAREMIAGIRYYLHSQGIEAVDYGEGDSAWFERLPAPRPGTMRPALVRENRVIRKGLAGEEL